MGNKYCAICTSNCKSIHACKLFMLSPSLPTHPFYLTCLECVFVWLQFLCSYSVFFTLLHSCFSAATTQQRSLKFHPVLVNTTHQIDEANYAEDGRWVCGRSGIKDPAEDLQIFAKNLSPQLWYVGKTWIKFRSVNVKCTNFHKNAEMVTQVTFWILVESS